MKTNPSPRNLSHPPLAHDRGGNAVPIPEGTAAWLLKRETGGRPKTIVGADRQPVRFALTTSVDDLEAMLGSGTFRVYALTEVGETIDYLTTLVIGAVDDESGAPPTTITHLSRAANGNGDPLRHALDTIAAMARAQSESLRAVSEAQADFLKGLATAKALPRNAYVPPPPLPAAVDAADEDDDDGDDQPPVSPWLQVIGGIVPAVNTWSEIAKARFSATRNAVPPAKRRVADAPDDDDDDDSTPQSTNDSAIRVAEVMAQLDEAERRWLARILRHAKGRDLPRELASLPTVDDAVALVEQCAAEYRERRGQRRATEAPPEEDPASEAYEQDVGSAFMARAGEIAAHLTPVEQQEVFALVPQIAANRGAELQRMLLAMSAADAAVWIRENLPALKKELGS